MVAIDLDNHTAQNATGEELYSRFLKGDNDAFEEFVLMYEDELARFIYGIVNDYHEAEHLTIETFSQFILNNKKFEGRSSIKTYLFAIGKNLAAKYIRGRGREQHIPFEDVVDTLIDAGDTLQSILEKRETRQYLQAAMQELKKEYHAVLVLLYFEDMSYIQAAQAMRKSEKQVKNLAHRAKAALRKEIESKGYSF